MKSKKVLFGLIVMAFIGSAGISSAQTKAIIEVGPDNIGGRTRAIVVDQRDASHKTLYAGAVAGGLFVKESESSTWDYIPYRNDAGEEIALPISCMTQTPDNMILIGTGEGIAVGENASPAIIAPKGSGIYRFNPETKAFSQISSTAAWAYTNSIAYLQRNGKTFVYAATNDGLYRWAIANESDWNNPTRLTNEPVQQVIIVSSDNMAFFTSGSKVYKIGNVTGESNPVDISISNTAFGGDATRISMAAAHSSDTTYLYAMVADESGMLDGVYVTYDQQNWTKITTSTIVPFSSKNSGWHNSSITVDPTNHKRIFIGGATLWRGQGFIAGSTYEWVNLSYSEDQLNAGNYMAQVYPNSLFVHSGIHQIIMNPEINDGDTTWIQYLATDGGIFKNNDGVFTSMNKGFNTVQFNGIAVAPDGSILGGAYDNGCPFVQARLARDGGSINDTWYDNTTTMNHMGNIAWFGNGGQVEASMFQQIYPISRRGLFFSAAGGDFMISSGMGIQSIANYGRAYADYSDYYNTQTWTSGEGFVEDLTASAGDIARMALYETTNNQGMDSITFTIDTLNYIIRDGVEMRTGGNFQIQAGDKFMVGSPAHFNYPFIYTFTQNYTLENSLTFTVHNPIANRIAISGKKANGSGIVMMNTTPTDYRKVWTAEDAGSNSVMHWYCAWKGDNDGRFLADNIAFSTDGDAIFIQVVNDSTKENFIVRISNLNACNINDRGVADQQISYEVAYEGMPRITRLDTLFRSGSDFIFNRQITSMFVDQRNGKDALVVTFGNGETSEPNVVIFNNANNPSTRTMQEKNIQNGNINAYSALIENTEGELFVGTDKGVFKAPLTSGSWSTYGAFNGVPVTSIRQQTRTLERQRYIGHTGFNEEVYLFAKTKYPNAIYFGTYGRGIFLDMSYCTDTTNAICNDDDYQGITTVDKGENRIAIFPNPATAFANLNITVTEAANATIKVYDINGRCIFSENMGRLTEGENAYRLDCQNFAHGMYLVNVVCGKQVATSKLIVR